MPALSTRTDVHIRRGEVMELTSDDEYLLIYLQPPLRVYNEPNPPPPTPSGPYPSLLNDGEIRFTSSDTMGVTLIGYDIILGGGSVITNNGLMRLDATRGGGRIIAPGNSQPVLHNYGEIVLNTAKDAFVFKDLFLKDFINEGTITVVGGGYVSAAMGNWQTQLFNSGTISVTSTGLSAWAVSVGDGSLDSWVINHGLIEAHATGEELGYAVGVDMGGAWNDITLDNYGTIRAEYAITAGGSAADGQHIIRNYGLLDGVVSLGGSRADFINEGTINGDVLLGGSADLFDSRTGTIVGDVYGQDGDDVIYLGVDNNFIDGGEGADRLDAGDGENYIYGANGNDTLISGAGDDTLNGGFNEDIADYSNATSGVTVDLRLSGAQETRGGGNDTLVSVEGVRGSAFSDVLTATYHWRENAGRLTKGQGVVNQSLEAAVSVDGLFALADDVWVDAPTTTPHVVVTAKNSGGTEYYKFTVTQAGEIGIFDIDAVDYSWNLMLTLYDSTGREILHNFAGLEQDPGSYVPADPQLRHTFAEAGVYYIAVAQENAQPFNPGVGYTLNVSLSNAPVLSGVRVGSQLFGGDGDDTLISSVGSDIFHGDDGVDTVVFSGPRSAYSFTTGANGTVRIIGPEGHDDLLGVERLRFSDITTDINGVIVIEPVNGTSAADTLTGNGYTDILNGHGGDDTLNGDAGDDRLIGGAGNDTLNGGSGSDTADYSGAAAGVTARIDTRSASNDGDGGTDTFTSIENLTGSAFNDLLVGDANANVLSGGLGRDTLIAGAGNDTLNGGSGAANELYGGDGDDTYIVEERTDSIVELAGEGIDTVRSALFQINLSANVENLTYTGTGTFTGVGNAVANVITGGTQRDVLMGLAGNDTLIGGAGAANELYGGAGDDTYVLDAGDSIIEGAGDGVDLVQLRGLRAYNLSANVENGMVIGTGDFSLNGNGLNNILTGGDGADTLQGGAGNDTLHGGAGIDTVTYILSTGPVNARLDVNRGVSDGLGGADTFTGIENLTGSNLADLLIGNAGDNVINGAIGNDILLGFDGNDTLIGGSGGGVNEMYGGRGDDTYIVDAADTLVELAGEGIDTVRTTNGNQTLAANIENLVYVGPGDFAGTGNAGANVITGGAGQDTLAGRGGDDTLVGGSGNDLAQMQGVRTDYTITAVDGGWRVVDAVAGRDGTDTLLGVERVRFSDGTVLVLSSLLPAAQAEVMPLLTDKSAETDDDAFVLPALADKAVFDLPLVLPGLDEAPTGRVAFTADDSGLVVIGPHGLHLLDVGAPAMGGGHDPWA